MQEETFPTALIDDFLQCFIVTRNDQSFYLDLQGNYDYHFHKIQWSNQVMRISKASPYLIALMQNSQIEVRNMLNPSKLIQRIDFE